MTEQEDRPNGAQTNATSHRNRWLVVSGALVAAIAVAGNLSGIGSFVIDLGNALNPSTPTSSATSTADVQPGPGDAGSIMENPVQGESSGTSANYCVNASGERSACDLPHHAEVFAPAGAECTQKSLVEYAGGTFMHDVLRPDLVISQAGPLQGCTVLVPLTLTQSIKDGLVAPNHGILRHCHNRLNDRDVSCNQPHTAEVVYSNADTGGKPVVCSTEADEYFGGTFSRHSQKLEVLSETLQNSVVCSVQAKGANVLMDSLRRIGTTALPLQPIS